MSSANQARQGLKALLEKARADQQSFLAAVNNAAAVVAIVDIHLTVDDDKALVVLWEKFVEADPSLRMS